MNALRLCLVLALSAWSFNGLAAEVPLANQDCREILEQFAANAKSVPKRLVDACKEQLAAAPVDVERPMVASAAAVDPCAGPNAADSALCWGPWAGIAPAAAAPLTALSIPELPGDCEAGSEIANQCVPLLEPLTQSLPLGSCTPGTPCGFATVVAVAGVPGSADPADSTFAKFNLAPDGTNFTVDPGGANEINSVAGMSTTITSRDDGYENLRATGRAGDDRSGIVARILRDDEGQIQLAADVWGHGNSATQSANLGRFAWGMATTPAGFETLNSGNVSVNFGGPMLADNSTTASMTVNFGTQPTWSGTWTNPAYAFDAGGTVTGADLISSPTQFSTNVVPTGSFVQGAVLGEPGSQALAHIIDVTLNDERRIKDVGMLREVVPQPIADSQP